MPDPDERYVVTVRITTLNVAEEPFDAGVGRRWNTQIRRGFSEANRIFNRYNISIERGHRMDLPVELSRQILGREEMARIQPSFRTIREGALSRGELQRHADPGDFVVVEGRRMQFLSDEEHTLLLYNRGPPQEVCSYWVPSTSCLGVTYHTEAFTGLDNREGIVIRRGVPDDTLAHELGHLLMRCTHQRLDAPGQRYPVTNLMSDPDREEPRELDTTQRDRIRHSQYAVLRRP